MAALGALVFLLAACWTSAYPSAQLADFPENVRGGPSRIVSGWEAEEGQIPYQLSLRMVTNDGFVFACGATIIHNEWALTAAHCTANRVTIVLRFGSIDLARPSLILETTEYYNHPLYIEALNIVQPHDIGLLKFNRFVEYTDVIKPIRMQSSIDKNNNYNGVVLEASGWGRTWTDGGSPQILNWVYLTGVSNVYCRNLFGSIILDSTICAGAYNVSSQSTCQGDSGGPLVVKDQDGKLTQVGISSFVSRTGCHTDFPAGFIRPGHYHKWYTEITGINFDWDFSEVPAETTTVEPEVKTTTPEVEEEVVTSTPEVEEEVVTSTPEVEEEVVTSTPEVEEEVVTSTPEVEEEVATSTPEVEEEVATSAPEVEEEVVTSTPEVEEEVATSAPEVEEEEEEVGEDNGNGEKDSEEEEEEDSDEEDEDDSDTSETDEEDTRESDEEDSKDSDEDEDSESED